MKIMKLCLFLILAAGFPLTIRGQLGVICKGGSHVAVGLFGILIEGNRQWIIENSPLTIPGLDENFGLARLHRCKMNGLHRTELIPPLDIECDADKAVLGITVGINNTDLVCDLTIGIGPTLAAHATLGFDLDRIVVHVVIQLPRTPRSNVKVAILKTVAKAVDGPKLSMTGLEPATSVISQIGTVGLRILPLFTRAFFSAFLSVEAPKILAKLNLPF